MSDQPDPLAEPDAETEEATVGSPSAEPEAETEEATSDSPSVERDADDGARLQRKRRKKQRKAREQPDAAATRARDELDENGRERPRFLLDFPADPELEKLISAFERGNYALVRELAPNLIEHAESIEVREAAVEIRRRIEPDPLLKYLLLASGLLLAVLVWYAYSQHGVHAH